MARINIEFVKTYATIKNAEKAVEKKGFEDRRYIIMPVETDEGTRYGVLFVGMEAIEAGVHFHFNVTA